jgi:uncharacterized damage-inducible protein DinB
MDLTDLTFLYAYNRWANAKVLEASRQVAPEALFAPAQTSFGSLMGTLAHILGTEIAWRLRMQEGISPTRLETAADFPTLAALAARWREEEVKMRGFIESLSAEDLRRWVSYTTLGGKPQGSTLWRALTHLILHSMQFRGEAGVVLAGLGHSPGDLDLLLYMRETDQR